MTTALAEDLAEDLDGTALAMARRFAAGAALWSLAPDSVAPAGKPVIAGRPPGRLAPPAPECTEEVCVTCRDEGRLAEVLEPPASVFGPVVHGDLVLVHACAALTRLDSTSTSTSTSTREGAR